MFAGSGDGKESQPSSSASASASAIQWSQPCRVFEFPEMLVATENFNESLVVGHGGFGKVYKGTIFNGSTPLDAAIKRLDSMSLQGAAEFWAEIEMLSKLRHCHLVSLIGYCNHGKEMILVYEYMPHGTLEDHLYKLATSISWVQRLKICIGAGRGLDYLHTGTGIESGVIHRDVKSSNILLHESWAAKISDFGLSKIGPTNQPSTFVSTLVKGTFGYLDPDYYATGRLTRKSDVYAFGVVLFQVLCRKRAVDRSLDEEQWNLARWAQESIKEGSLKHIIDSDIRGQISPKCLKEFVRIAQRCLHSHPKQRPTMAEVVVCLQSVLTLQEKISSSSHTAGRTIFGRLADMLPFPSNEENYAHGDSKLSSNRKGSSKNVSNTVEADNMLLETKEPPADCRIPSPNMKVFKFDDLKRATRNFGLDLGLGIRKEYSGQLFLGYVDKNTFAPSTRGVGIAVAVSRHDQASVKGHAEWLEEVSIRERLAHPNIISVVGYCNDEHENLLVYEYMENQSFDHFLFRGAPDNAEPLSWGTRLIIMMGVARGLAYLHSSKDQSLYHDVKSHNIFLDQDFNAKLGDFGLIRSHFGIWDDYYYTRVISFDDHEDPEYILTGNLNAKSDIYSFGVVLLETLTGLRGIDHKRPRKQMNLVAWARPILERKKGLEKLMDPRLEQNYPLEGALRCGALILTCIESNPKMRPSSEEVLQSLEQIYAINREGPLQTS